MSDLGAIFHVKKDGVQYDAHAYTTLDECPEPNLKIKFKGSQAYIKLEAKGSGDVPCHVKTKTGGVYQVKKEAISTGATGITVGDPFEFTVPPGITIIEICGVENGDAYTSHIQYVGVTPGKTYSLFARLVLPPPPRASLLIDTDNNINWAKLVTILVDSFTLSWSPEINKQTPNVTDY